MIDLHTHVLPGVDDGARTVAESLDMARAAVADGVRLLAATPHVREDYPTGADTVERLVAQLQRTVLAAGIALDLRPGGELAVDKLAELSLDELWRFGLAGNPRYLLVEFPYYGWPLALGERVLRLRAAGITPVLGHPERNGDVQAAPERLGSLVRAGALVQLTAGSLDGSFGRTARSTAEALLALEYAHLVGTDAHGPGIRRAGMSDAARALDDDRLARWLTNDVPEAIVTGGDVPPRPRAARRDGGWLRRHARLRRPR